MSEEALEIDACWQRIGVRGDRSCPELRAHIHCRNCPVHAEAAGVLLDRPLAADHHSSLAGHFASRSAMPRSQEKSAFLFRILGEWLALRCAFVQEVVNPRTLHSLPHRSDAAVLGLVNIRGELVVLVSLAAVLGITAESGFLPASSTRNAFARLLVAGTAEHRVAFPVDEAFGIIRYTAQDMSNIPATLEDARLSQTATIIRWQNRAAGLLDADRLMHRLDRIIA